MKDPEFWVWITSKKKIVEGLKNINLVPFFVFFQVFIM